MPLSTPGVPGVPAFGCGRHTNLAVETPGSSSGVGYGLRREADLMQTDRVFAWPATPLAVMAAPETGILRPFENHLSRRQNEAESA